MGLDARAQVSGAEAVIANLKLLIAKLKQEKYGASAERGRKLDQLELQLEEIEANVAEDQTTAQATPRDQDGAQRSPDRRKPVRSPFPAHLPRERVVIAGPATCPCCQGKLANLGEDITETLEAVPRSWKVVQTVREKFTCRAGETISQAPSPFHVIARGRAGPEPFGNDFGGQIRPASAAQPAE